ncbi:LuxR C-terminal-related transcriptional regulator [Flaviflagellibacter deserti]|uniref:LuxR C-terminal-related transcriptional regulator n=1 Tax=Flaviflagellibacter deserti TaxID=2267266 RepID=A0ABV9Z292_9HYPH
MQQMPFETVLAGQNVLLREGLARVLPPSDFKIVASTTCIDDHVVALVTRENAALLIIDVSDDFDAAIAQIECFKRQCPLGRVVVLAHQHLFPEIVSALRAGANAYLVNIATCEAFIKSLELVMLGETVLPPAMLTAIFDHESDRLVGHRICYNNQKCIEDRLAGPRHLDDDDADTSYDNGAAVRELPPVGGGCTPRLSIRQKSILSCLTEGDSNKVIARKMNIAEATVKVHVKAILRRIHVHNRTQAAIWAMNSGLFFSAKDVHRSPGLLNETPADLDVANVSPSGLIKRSPPAREPNGAGRAALSNLGLLLRNGVHRSGH